MQSDDAKNLTYEQNRMYMYGNNDQGGAPDSWPMWTHSSPTDTQSDDTLEKPMRWGLPIKVAGREHSLLRGHIQ